MISRIVLTGGPSGGKTTAVKYIQKRLPELGIKPIIVPELATMMFKSGIKWKDVEQHPALAFKFQIGMIKTQMQNEDMIYSFAHLAPGQKKVVVCDRGTIDNMVYSWDEWHEDILSQVGTMGFLKRRYDGFPSPSVHIMKEYTSALYLVKLVNSSKKMVHTRRTLRLL